MKKAIYLVVILVLSLTMLLALVGCGESGAEAYYNDELIKKEFTSYTADKLKYKKEGDFSYTAECENFDGIKTIRRVVIFEKDVDYNVNYSCTSGSFKVVIIDSEGVVTTVIDNTMPTEMRLYLYKGEYALKMVGIDATFSFSMMCNDENNRNNNQNNSSN